MSVWTKRKGFSVVLGLMVLVNIVNCIDNIDPEMERIVESDIDSLSDPNKYRGLNNLKKIVEFVTGYRIREFIGNETEFGKNSLWHGLYEQCGQRATLACVKENVFSYLDTSLGLEGDFEVTDSMVFTRNGYVENKYDRKLNEIDKNDRESSNVKLIPVSYSGWDHKSKGDTGNEGRDGRSMTEAETPTTFEGLTDRLYGKAVTFIKGHDLTLQLPEMFGGATLRFLPQALEGDGGALVKLEMNPNASNEVESRLFKGKIKKKLMYAAMALLLVVKLIKLKLFFLLPMLIGAGAAKQFLLKILLFLFPAFSHLFKICSYYQGVHGHGHHGKYHHHHHKIAHHHHHIRVPVPVPVHHGIPHAEYGPPEHYPGPPLGGAYAEDQGGYASDLGAQEYESNHRSDVLTQHALKNEKELASWGLGMNSYQGSYKPSYNPFYDDVRLTRSAQPVTEANVYYAQPQPVYSSPVQQAQPQPSAVRYSPQAAQKELMAQNIRLQVLTPSPHVQATTVLVTYDPFYSPILQRMDNVFVQLGFNEEACRERLVCSMYKNPQRFSPHSNLISAELSRDPQELQKPAVTNSAVARFHRYVEAARRGQDRGDCIRLYAACTVNTE